VVDGRTVIAIAHRLQTAHDADRVAVVVDGQVVELGSHDELIAADGSYAKLWASWHGLPEADAGSHVPPEADTGSHIVGAAGREPAGHRTLSP
jgi:ABC-type multidrug transport system ATPase subunit